MMSPDQTDASRNQISVRFANADGSSAEATQNPAVSFTLLPGPFFYPVSGFLSPSKPAAVQEGQATHLEQSDDSHELTF